MLRFQGLADPPWKPPVWFVFGVLARGLVVTKVGSDCKLVNNLTQNKLAHFTTGLHVLVKRRAKNGTDSLSWCKRCFFAVVSTGFSKSLALIHSSQALSCIKRWHCHQLASAKKSSFVFWFLVSFQGHFSAVCQNEHVKYITCRWEHSIRDVRSVSYVLSEQPYWPVSQNIHNIFCTEKICPSQHDETSWHSWHVVFTWGSPQPPASSCQQQGI